MNINDSLEIESIEIPSVSLQEPLSIDCLDTPLIYYNKNEDYYNSIMEPDPDETEVYFLNLKQGKYYKTALYTRKTGTWYQKKQRFFTTHPLKYVGLFIKTNYIGSGPGRKTYSYFDNDGQEEIVEHIFEITDTFTYDETTCFVETRCPNEYIMK